MSRDSCGGPFPVMTSWLSKLNILFVQLDHGNAARVFKLWSSHSSGKYCLSRSVAGSSRPSLCKLLADSDCEDEEEQALAGSVESDVEVEKPTKRSRPTITESSSPAAAHELQKARAANWREMVLDAMAATGGNAFDQSRPFRVQHGCAGTGAVAMALRVCSERGKQIQEVFGLKDLLLVIVLVFLQASALEIPFIEQCTVEPKKHAKEFMCRNVPSACNFEYVEKVTMALVAGVPAWCTHHARECPVPPVGTADVWVSGFPCAPYSIQRGDKAKRKCITQRQCQTKGLQQSCP
eukprot:5271750-Amphidinium_carterae.5